jgi:hypothetical protein
MEFAGRLPHGCAQLRGKALRVGKKDRTWLDPSMADARGVIAGRDASGFNERHPQTPEGNLRIAANIVSGQSLAAHTHNAFKGASR